MASCDSCTQVINATATCTVIADEPHGREDVDTCLRAVVAGLARTGARDLMVDGHEVDPHLYPVPRVTGAGLHLLRLS